MGSACSGGGGSYEGRRAVQVKAPVLLFGLPGPARDLALKGIKGAESVGIRFIDVGAQRSARRFWVKELQGRKDFAAIIYLADVRDHPSLLLNVRTLNWFLRGVQSGYDMKVVCIYQNVSELDELRSCMACDVDLQPLCLTDPETIEQYIKLLQGIELNYSEQRGTQNVTTTLGLL
jgi:hypothetical protein